MATHELVAFMNESTVPDLPIGKKKWYILENLSCPLEENLWRYLNFHPFTEKPGHFCCDSGVCIDSELVCDNNKNCEDNEDEVDCQIINKPLNYNNHFPPLLTEKIGRHVSTIKTRVEAIISNLNVLEINPEKSYITILFNLKLEWNDGRLEFNFLKSMKEKNVINEETLQTIWIPKVKLLHTEELEILNNHVLIEKNSTGTIDFELPEINPKEVYEGNFFLKKIIS